MGKNVEGMSDFYAGGMLMPGRIFNSNSYRYGWNKGSEKDDEITGVTSAHYTTFFREYDTRIGRTWSIDPVFQPWQSPYNSMDNNPILFNDPKGNWVKSAGVIRNLFNSDNKINAQDRAAATGGRAFKDGKGWTVNFSTNETVDFGNGSQNLNIFNVEHYGKKEGNKFAEGYNRAGDIIDNFMKDDPTGLGKINTKEGSALHSFAKGVAGLGMGIPNGVLVLTTGTDIYNKEATSTTDKIFATAAIVSVFAPAISHATLGKATAGEIIDNANTAIQFINDVGLFNQLKPKESSKDSIIKE